MKSKLLVFLIALLPLAAFAQNEMFKGEPFIEVTGTAHQEIEPNEIFLVVRLQEFEENREKIALEKLDKDFFNAVKEAGIDKKRLELADAGSQIGKLGRRDKDAFRVKTYQLKLTSAAELETLLGKLEPVKVSYADVVRVSHTDIEKLKVDLKIKALHAARAKAEYLLKSVGSEVGKPLMIREWDIDPVQPMMDYANVRMKTEAAQSGGFDEQETAVGFKKIKLQAQVVAQFAIK